MDDTTKRRLQLLALGYHILPTYGKIAKLKGWNRPEFIARELDPERIEQWPLIYKRLKSTGVRLENGLRAVDIDVDDGPIVEALLAYVATIAPDVAAHAPTRYGGGAHKLTLFVRAPKGDEAFSYDASRRYLRPGDPEDEDHKVELFGGAPARNGNCARQCGIYGPHSYHDDGTVRCEYVWAEGVPALHEVKAVDLPELSKAQMLAIAGEFERLAEAAGWSKVERPDVGNSGVVYDINDQSRFDTDKGDKKIDYAALCEAQTVHGDLRCSSSFMGGEGKRKDRCWVYWSDRHDCVAVYEYGAAISHYPETAAPRLDRIAEQLKEMMTRPNSGEIEPLSPDEAASLNEKAEWLIQTRGYLEGEDSVVLLYSTSLDCRVKPSAFERRFRAWFRPGASVRAKPIFATDLWNLSPERKNIAGIRMRPDQPFPLYEESGQWFKNTYRRPYHDAKGGDISEFMAFMMRFIPDHGEREWLFDWMAHKQLRPDIPGTSVFFVADTEEGVREGAFGTGRGLMFKILHRLYGEAYTRAQSFAMLDGSSGQSVFNDWLHGSVLVTVNESKTSPTSYRRGERSAAYEMLKELVDPAPQLHRFNGKHRQAFDGMSYCSIVVATNHGDAMAIPANDRRFTILRNGRELTPGEAEAIVAWLGNKANIGAMSAWLWSRDISNFNMFRPLATVGKVEMAEMARSDVEECLHDLMTDEKRGLAFTKEHIEKVLENNFNGHGQYWRGEFKSAWHAYVVSLKNENGNPIRVRTAGTQRKLFCFRDRLREVKKMPEVTIRREVAKWGKIDPWESLKEINDLSTKDEILQ